MDIAISGKLASGKSTAAKILAQLVQEHKTYIPVQRRFASRLYQLCANLDGATEWSEDGWKPSPSFTHSGDQLEVISNFFNEVAQLNPHISPSVNHLVHIHQLATRYPTRREKNRERLREIAEYVRGIDPMIWINFVQASITVDQISPNHISIISDMRNPIEAEWCRTQGILRLRVDVSPQVQKERMSSRGEAWTFDRVNHYTETALDAYPLFTTRVNNDGGEEQLTHQLRTFFTHHFDAQQEKLEVDLPILKDFLKSQGHSN